MQNLKNNFILDSFQLEELTFTESLEINGGESFGFRFGQAMGNIWNGLKSVDKFLKEHSNQDMGIPFGA